MKYMRQSYNCKDKMKKSNKEKNLKGNQQRSHFPDQDQDQGQGQDQNPNQNKIQDQNINSNKFLKKIKKIKNNKVKFHLKIN